MNINGTSKAQLIAFFKSRGLPKYFDRFVKFITTEKLTTDNIPAVIFSIHLAAYDGDHETLSAILGLIPEDKLAYIINIRSRKGRTALYWTSGNVKCTEAIFNTGAVDFYDPINAKAIALSIRIAAYDGDHENLSAILGLIPEGKLANIINIPNDDGFTALYWAAEHRHEKCVEALMKTDVVCGYISVLNRAIQSGNTECVRAILQSPAGPSISIEELEYISINALSDEVKN